MIKNRKTNKSLTYCNYYKLKEVFGCKEPLGVQPEGDQGGSGALMGTRGGTAGGLGGIGGPLWKPNGGGRGGAP